MKLKCISWFCYFFIFCGFSITVSGQDAKTNPIEEILIGTWIEVPGNAGQNKAFNTNYLTPDTARFFRNKTMKNYEKGQYIDAVWEIDKETQHLKILEKYEGYPPVSYEFKFLDITENNFTIEATDEDPGEGEEPFRVSMRKLPEK